MAKRSPSSPAAFTARFEPRNPAQEEASELWAASDVLFLLGPAGTGKTLAAVGLAAVDVAAGKFDKLVVLRPAVEADRTLGFLPGSLREKVEPFARPVVEALKKVAYNFPPDKLHLDVLGLVRGLTFSRCCVVVDEAQNASYKQLKLLLTRLGPGSKVVVCGDPEQSDVRPSGGYESDLDEVADALDGCPGVGVVEFRDEDCVRHPRLRAILSRLRR